MTKFSGFRAVTDRGTPCFVLNEGELSDGTPAFKVRLGYYGPYYSSWESVRRDVFYTGKVGWIAKSKVRKK